MISRPRLTQNVRPTTMINAYFPQASRTYYRYATWSAALLWWPTVLQFNNVVNYNQRYSRPSSHPTSQAEAGRSRTAKYAIAYLAAASS